MAEASPNPEEISHWFKLGNDLLNSGQYEKAALAFDRVIEIESRNAEAWNNRGLAQASLNILEDAARSFDRAGSIDVAHPSAWYNKGMMLCALERYEEAVNSFEKALQIDPKNAHAWHNKGVALTRLGWDAEARFAFSCAGWIALHGGRVTEII